MRPAIYHVLAVPFAMLALASLGWAQEREDAASGDAERAALEAELEQRLSGVLFEGAFTDDAVELEGSPPHDSYEVRKVTQLEGGRWRFDAVIGFTQRGVVLPLVVDVEWAGSTPVIVVEDLQVPFLGSYSARVLIHGERYAGTWQGSGHGGHVWGTIRPIPARAAEQYVPSAEAALASWPQFRGPRASGVANGYVTPERWDVDTGENVRWRVEVPGLAHSSPVVWGERVFLTTAVRADGGEADLKVGYYGEVLPVADEGEHEFRVLALDAETGAVAWDALAHRGVPAIKRHTKGSHAASTPATDGEHVVASFGSEGLYCYGAGGELLWSVDLGRLDAGWYVMPPMQWGFGSSPVIHDGLVLVQCDVQGDDFLAAFRVADGAEVWRTPREEVPTWGTPTVDVRDGRAQVVCNGYKRIGGYDLATGAPLWWLAGGGDIPVPTPVVANDLVFVTNAHGRMAPILAIEALAEGELSMDPAQCEDMAWSHERRGNYMQTPLVVGPHLYLCSDIGVLACYVARTGEEVYRERVGDGETVFTASAVAASGRVYLTSEVGEIHVVGVGPEFEALAVNDMQEECMATPAISAGALYIRSRRHLTAVAHP